MIKIKELRKKHNMSQAELANLLHVHQNAISQWETGRTAPDIEQYAKMAKLFETSVDDLMGFDRPQTPTAPRNVIRLPVLGNVAAGVPIEAITDVDDIEEIDLKKYPIGEYAALRVKGHSMEPRLLEGDVVIVRIQDTIENGEIAIVMVGNDEATCKKIKKTPEGVTLISTNPIYEPMFYTNKEIEDLPVRIFGRVVEYRCKI